MARIQIELKVDVYEEYLLWSVSTLVGNIGGMLGMTIGFSFFGYIGMVLVPVPVLPQLSSSEDVLLIREG